MLNNVDKGREFFKRHAWRDSYDHFLQASQSNKLGIEDLEQLATSAYLIGRETDFQKYLDLAHQLCIQSGERARAARCAFWLGLTSMFRGEFGQANGWLSRAQSFIHDLDCVELGYLLLPQIELLLSEGKLDEAQMLADQSVVYGQRYFDKDLIAVARHLQGRILIQQGKITSGLVQLDETMLMVVGGELSPIVTGLIYCSVIEACHRVYAFSRAREWTDALSKWCDQQPDLMAFTGQCMIHRAEIKQINGAWPEALEESQRVCDRFKQGIDPQPPATAFYRLGELNRLRGNYAAAEDAYREAGQMGLEPHPGLALLRLAQGRTDVASAALSRLLDATNDALERAKILPACVEISLNKEDYVQAQKDCAELQTIAGQYGTDVLQALAAHTQGMVELAEANAAAALRSFRKAFEQWQKIEAPYETARARLMIGAACRKLEDEEAASMAWEAARKIFQQLGARPDLDLLDSLINANTKPSDSPLSPRELQVLQSIAAGKTNKIIAKELQLSERTVDRHVSNILTKLDVPSRSAAIAHAYENKLI